MHGSNPRNDGDESDDQDPKRKQPEGGYPSIGTPGPSDISLSSRSSASESARQRPETRSELDKISVRMPDELLAELDAVVREAGWESRSEMIRQMLRVQLERERQALEIQRNRSRGMD
jgi:hypothetical protein